MTSLQTQEAGLVTLLTHPCTGYAILGDVDAVENKTWEYAIQGGGKSITINFEQVDKDGDIEREVTAACHFWILFNSFQQSLHSLSVSFQTLSEELVQFFSCESQYFNMWRDNLV